MREEIEKTIGELKHSYPTKPLVCALIDRLNKEMTQTELTAICLRWSYHYALNDLAYKQLPITPDFVMEFKMKSLKAQEKVLENRGEVSRKLIAHFTLVSSIKEQNRVNKAWLNRMLLYFTDTKETKKVDKIKEVLSGNCQTA